MEPLDIETKTDYDRHADAYARHRAVNPALLAALSGAAGGAGARVLEVGAGTGNHILALAEATGCEGHGVEPSGEMRARAQVRAGGVSFVAGRAEGLEFPDASFDLIFSVDVIHHVGDRAAYFAEAWRILKSGGRICTATDSEETLRARRPLAVYFPEIVAVELKRYPRIATLKAEMAAAGFGGLAEEEVAHGFEVESADPYREKAFSSLLYIDEAAFDRGLARMEADLARGPIAGLSRYLLLWGTKA